MVLEIFLLLPLLLVSFWIILFFQKRRRGLLGSAISFLFAIALGVWSILQSRSSTAAIGLIYLPAYACLSGLLVWIFFQFKEHREIFKKIVAWICIVLNTVLLLAGIQQSLRQKVLNQERDQAQVLRDETILRNREYIRRNLQENKGHESEWLNSEIQKREKEELFLIPALETSFANPDILERLSHSEFSGVVLMVARNSVTSSKTLDGIFERNSKTQFFYQDLAANQNTPAEILRKIFESKESVIAAGQWLAKNPSTPKDILSKLANSKEVIVLMSLLENVQLDCSINSAVQKSLREPNLKDTYRYLERARDLANQYEIQNCQKKEY